MQRMGYSRIAFKGISWITLLRIGTRGTTFLRLAILGRLLTPSQFGYFGIASLLLILLEIITETGINIFLVQHKGKIEKYISSAWIVSMIRGLVLSLIILISSKYIASFFGSPEAINIIRMIAIVPLIRGFINPAIIIYQKDLLFKKEFSLRSILFVIDVAVSIVFAYITRSAVAFVYGFIASAFIEVILSYLLIKPWPKFEFEFDKVKTIVKKGFWVTLTGIFSYISDNGDNLVVGRLLGSASLGIYQVAYKFSTLPISEITNVVNQVIFPVYSKIADDKIRMRKAFAKVTALTLISAMILGFAIFFFAEQIVFFVMGDQWMLAVPLVRILAIYGALRASFGSTSPLFLAIGRQDIVAKTTLIRALSVAILIIPFINLYGMIGAGYAMMISVVLETPFILFYIYKVLK